MTDDVVAVISWYDAEHGDLSATLHDDARWTGDDRRAAVSLNLLLSCEDRSPARGDWIVAHAEAMARMLDATIEHGRRDPIPAGYLP